MYDNESEREEAKKQVVSQECWKDDLTHTVAQATDTQKKERDESASE